MSYIIALDRPKSLNALRFNEFNQLKEEREIIDGLIIDWISGLSEENIKGCISYKNMAGVTFNKPFASLISHLFLHQVHHRGQATTLLSQYGINFGETVVVQ